MIFSFSIWSYQYNCPVGGPERPYAVSITKGRCDNAQNLLQLKRERSRPNGNFTICISPFFFEYDDVAQLVEMVETNRMFGADYFVFYNLTIGPNVDKYLRYYMNKGIADVIQWHLPRGNINDSFGGVYYFAQIATLSDCLLRTLGKSHFISFTDIDEVIVPRSVNSFQDLVEKYQDTLKNCCSLIIRNTFFRSDWPSNRRYANSSATSQYRINALLKTTREAKIWALGVRSKYIARTVDLKVPTLHVPIICRSRKVRGGVQFTDALLHHYGAWENPKVHADAAKDTFMNRYSTKLLRRVRLIHEALGWTL